MEQPSHHTPFFSTHTEIHEILRIILLNVRERSKPSAQIPKHQPLATLRAPRKSSRSPQLFNTPQQPFPAFPSRRSLPSGRKSLVFLQFPSQEAGPKSGGYEAFLFIEREYEMPKSSFSYCRSRPSCSHQFTSAEVMLRISMVALKYPQIVRQRTAYYRNTGLGQLPVYWLLCQ